MTARVQHPGRTLFLTAVLHAFTHLYHVALLPLYLLIMRDPALGLANIDRATFLVTAMMIAYFLPAYFVGALADRFSKKKLLAWGLAINALGFLLLSQAHTYPAAVAAIALAGFGGSFYHPAATALIARLYPVGTGKALGLLGVGASFGFFAGPIYTGWRGASAGWRAPVFEIALLGLVAAALFAWIADDEPPHPPETPRPNPPMFPTSALWLLFLGAAFSFALRDFTGNSMGSLNSLFLQKARLFDPAETGRMLSLIFLASAISNPLFGHLSDRNQSASLMFVLVIASLLVLIFPHLPAHWTGLALAAYGFFFMSSFAMVEAALMNAVPHEVRGRVFGLFITIGGLIGNMAHWLAGVWVSSLGAAAYTAESYHRTYAFLAALVLLSLMGLPCLKALRQRETATEPLGLAPAPR